MKPGNITNARDLIAFKAAAAQLRADLSSPVTAGRVYIYCSNDDESPLEVKHNIPNVCFVSSRDLKNRTDHDSFFRAEDSTTGARKTSAPAANERDGKFFRDFGAGGANIGIATAPTPIGPVIEPSGKPLLTHNTPGGPDLYLKFTGGDQSLMNRDPGKFD